MNGFFKSLIFFFQAEDGIRDAQESRGLGDVYKRPDCNVSKFLLKIPIRSLGKRNKLLALPIAPSCLPLKNYHS